jgi:hypothetical protein
MLKTIKKLDEILNLLYTKKIGDDPLITSQRNEYINEFDAAKSLNISAQELGYFLALLEEDKHVKIVLYDNERNLKSCFITIKGKFFKESGGYLQIEKDKSNERVLRMIEKVLLVFGAVAAGIYSLYQLYQAIFPNCYCHH